MLSNAQIGRIGENEAVKYLKGRGHAIIRRNYELPMGEIDIVSKKGGRLCFTEVKTSFEVGDSWFRPLDRVDKRKRRRLQQLCEVYCIRESVDAKTEWQIDVISVTLDKDGKNPKIQHIENAVWDYRGV